jgi:two-component system cell cycle response regulator CtrA
MHVLVIEDDVTTARSIQLCLERAGMTVCIADRGVDGIELAKANDYDVILLDLTLPDMKGQDILRALRRDGIGTPVMVLTGSQDFESKLQTLGSGADDFVTKPFSRDELLARIRAVVRRNQGHSQVAVTIGALHINLDAQTVEVSGKPLRLTAKEYQILELLVLRKGMTLTKEMFLNHLYAGRDEPDAKIIDVFICKLRKKIAMATGGDSYIETVWGRGYLLREPRAVAEDMGEFLGVA